MAKKPCRCPHCGDTHEVTISREVIEKYHAGDGYIYRYRPTGEYRVPNYGELYLDNHGNVLERDNDHIGKQVIVKYLGCEVSHLD